MALVLFVCTGNICRSAMAEGIARERVTGAEGLEFASAGTWPVLGGATVEAVAAARELGVDISGHRSRPLTEDFVRAAKRIYGMTSHHIDAVRRLGGEGVGELLDPSGYEIDDPYGGSMADYRRARDGIAVAIAARRDEWRTFTG